MPTSRHSTINDTDELFIVDGFDVIPRDDMTTMEYPFFSLTKKPVFHMPPYRTSKGVIEFRVDPKYGSPTIYDKDFVIYTISRVILEMNAGKDLPEFVEFSPTDYFNFVGKPNGGNQYKQLIGTIDRLAGAMFYTEIPINGETETSWRKLIGDVRLLGDKSKGKARRIKVQLSPLLKESIQNKRILTLNREYFRIARPVDRRIYQVARKFCGTQNSWKVSTNVLRGILGVKSTVRILRQSIKRLEREGILPDYNVFYIEDEDRAEFVPRTEFLQRMNKAKKTANGSLDDNVVLPPLETWTYEKVRQYSGRTDVYALEDEWRETWRKSGKPHFDNHNAAFISYCKKRFSNGESIQTSLFA